MSDQAKPKNQASGDGKLRTHLPMRNTSRPTLVTYDAKDPDTRFPPIDQLRPPKGAPNVLMRGEASARAAR